jgi:ring-1,2-phenylacetyl-CoA epoxidase subunit PaaC
LSSGSRIRISCSRSASANGSACPALEEDLGLANVSLDLLGQARLLLTHAGSLEAAAAARTLAYLREESEYLNLTLVEQPNGDFGDTIVRQCLFDAWQLGLYEALAQSKDATLAAVAGKGLGNRRITCATAAAG